MRRTGASARLLLTLFALFAFGLQSYLVQTHIHTATAVSASKSSPDRLPAKDDPANCPICQEILHTGQFVTPTAALLVLPGASISVVELDVAIPKFAQGPAHAWQSRAPPAA
jgi:hypothetical protein